MKVTENNPYTFTLVRASSREEWPTDWAKACGFNDGRQPTNLEFRDGDFIGHSVIVTFDPANPRNAQLTKLKGAVETAAGKRDMIVKWANSLPNRMAILKFWEWLQKESPSFNEASSGYDIEKLLDRYHEIDRKQLDRERQALLDAQG